MKLIDLLVRELPKRGGWPDGAEIAVQDADSQICFSSHSDVYADKHQTDWYGGDWGGGNWSNPFVDTIADDRHECIVSRKQYESALAESQKPAWDGEGVPPAGCECEFISNGTSWGKVKVIGFDGEKIVIRPSGEIYYAITPSNKDVFIPFRTEAERKHEAVLESICAVLEMVAQDYKREDEAKLIYEAIAAGKIPGVKLDD
ncbi:hypothetical protein H0J91_004545 [Salmonella enterica]|nr:hypothetical protein [Salmonella enterica]EFT8513313.1 hypothetical protein [Salmonella enterica]